MIKTAKPSREARAIVAHLTQRNFEDPAFEKRMNDLFKKSEQEVLKGLAQYIKDEFPDWSDKELEKEILKDLTLMLDSKAGTVRLLKRRSRQSHGGSGS